jgi:hypothetical protein
MHNILFRLIRDGKVVGYEQYEYTVDRWLYVKDDKTTSWSSNVIKHDRKDMWTGLEDKNGRKIFERDKCRFYDMLESPDEETLVDGIVVWYPIKCGLILQEVKKNHKGGHYIHNWDVIDNVEVIGIEGVEEGI